MSVAVDEILADALSGMRLDRVVAMAAEVSRSAAAELLAQGAVSLNGKVTRTGSARVEAGQRLCVTATSEHAPSEPAAPQPDPTVEFGVVYHDDDVVVVDKPSSLVVHPGAGRPDGTLVNGLLATYPDLAHVGERDRPGIVHRLDQNTSGLLVVARTARAHQNLVEQFAGRRPEREYSALVWGHPDADAGAVDAPIGRSARNPLRMTVSRRGRPAVTRYKVERRFGEPGVVSLLACRLETGRTHQIRVHLLAIGHPVVGDPTYNDPSTPRGATGSFSTLDRPFLHARSLSFRHPVTGSVMTFESPLPGDLRAVLDTCR